MLTHVLPQKRAHLINIQGLPYHLSLDGHIVFGTARALDTAKWDAEPLSTANSVGGRHLLGLFLPQVYQFLLG